jgi:hypothetical protein
MDSSTPCWNDVIEVLELTEAPPPGIFEGGDHEGHEGFAYFLIINFVLFVCFVVKFAVSFVAAARPGLDGGGYETQRE